MENSESRHPTARQMINAFVHPPTRLPIDKRFGGDPVVVLSHVELWPWRVVIRALAANPGFDPMPVQLPPGPEGGPVGFGVVTAEILHTDQRHADLRRSVDWMNSWSLTDDAGVVYHSTGWDWSPSDEQLWCDLAWTFDGVVAPATRRLIIAGPVVGVVEVEIRE